MNTLLQIRVQKTIAYLKSEQGRINWYLNIGRGYTDKMNYLAAVQTATRLIKYETICDVLSRVKDLMNRKTA